MGLIDTLCGKPEELLSVEMPEWSEGDETCVIYFTPFTLEDLKKIRSKAKDSEEEMVVYTIITKALDKNGNALFSLEDKQKLMRRVPSDQLSRLVVEMNRASAGN